MEIISKLDTDNWSTEHACNNCESRLKINRHDLHSKLVKAYSYEEEDYCVYSVSCPVCKKPSTISLNTIPKLIQIEN